MPIVVEPDTPFSPPAAGAEVYHAAHAAGPGQWSLSSPERDGLQRVLSLLEVAPGLPAVRS